MHISIPTSEELVGEKGKKYVSYNIHINGTYHCSARYSTLLALNDRLKKQYGQGCLEQFPGKGFMYMRPEHAHDRRYRLQRWLQKIGGQKLIVEGETFQTFLLNAQKEVQKGPEQDVQLEIFLSNGKSVKCDIMSTDQTDDVLETAASVIGLNENLTYYFGLYMVEDASGKYTIRKLQDFESPYVSLGRAPEGYKIMLRKAYWSSELDEALYEDPIALNLIYIETITDIKSGSIVVSDDVADDLANHRANKDRKNFLAIAQKLNGYGDHTFGHCMTNYPKPGTKAKLSLGNTILKLQTEDGKEHTFRLQLMRCWRTATIFPSEDLKKRFPPDGLIEMDDKKCTVEMEFEYFFESTQKMGWVKFVSPQTIHLAMCLQFMVEEMLRTRKKAPIKKPSDRVGAFKPRRQKEGAKLDMDFLTSDAGGGAAAAANPMAALLGGSAIRISVTLSELKARVEKADQESGSDNILIDMSVLGIDTATEADPDDYNEDEDGNAFAALVGV